MKSFRARGDFYERFSGAAVPRNANLCRWRALSCRDAKEEIMKKTLAVLATVAAVGVTAVAAPAQARGIGPGLAFGLAAGAITAGAVAASHPYGYYGPGYGYYGGPAYYGPGPYAYYGDGPYYRHHHYYRHW
jgi:hypothetical protein